MNMQQFITELRKRLSQLSTKDMEEVIKFHEELICDYIENGLSEEEAVKKLGSIDEIVSKNTNEFMEDKDVNAKEDYERTKNAVSLSNFPLSRGKKEVPLSLKNFSNIDINIISSNVVIEENNINEPKIIYTNTSYLKHSFYQDGNTLCVKEDSKRINHYIYRIIMCVLICILLALLLDEPFKIWGVIVGIIVFQVFFLLLDLYLKVDLIKISLPKKQIDKLTINGKYGNVKVKSLSLQQIQVMLTSGNIKLIDLVSQEYNLKVKSGNIKIINDELEKPSKSKNINVTATSGNIKIYNIITDQMKAKCKSGNVSLKSVICQNVLTLGATSGNVKGIKIEAKNIDANVWSGNIKLKYIKSSEKINASATSGNIKVSYLEHKDLEANAKSGAIKIINIQGERRECKLDLKSRTGLVRVKEFAGGAKDIIDGQQNTFSINKTIKANVNSGIIKVKFNND